VPSGDWFCPGCGPFFIRLGQPRHTELSSSDTPLRYHPFDPYLDEDLLHFISYFHQINVISHLPAREIIDVRRRGSFCRMHRTLPRWLMVFKKFRHASRQWLMCPPIEVRWDIIAMFHDALGHPGIAQTLRVLHMHYHWVGIKHDVALYVECCEPCQKVKIEIPLEPELQCPRVYGPLDHIHVDLFGP